MADSAGLIVLDQIGYFHLIGELFSPVMIPPSVATELPYVLVGIQVRAVQDSAVPTVLKMQVDEGEAEVMALALEMDDPWVLLDDKKARRVAQQLNLRVIGTVGLFLRAKVNRLVPEVKPLLDAALQADFRISTALYRETLKLSGEAG